MNSRGAVSPFDRLRVRFHGLTEILMLSLSKHETSPTVTGIMLDEL
jgi:hypothetical protein